METSESYNRALELLENIATPHGFLASEMKKDNYFRIFSRDGIIISLSAMLTGKDKFREAFLHTLRTLATHQGEHGEIPSNVPLPGEGDVSYGRTTGRVDAVLWFIIGCGQYFKRTEDGNFLKEMMPKLKKCIFLLGAWEFNQKGFVFVPPTGNWADEYIQEGYVLYDELLYFRALKEFAYLTEKNSEDSAVYLQKANKLKVSIHTNYWVYNTKADDPNIYHKGLFQKAKNYCSKSECFWLPYFSPLGYGFQFDSFANSLTAIFDVADENQSNKSDEVIAKRFGEKTNFLLPAFDPVIDEKDKRWDQLQSAFSFSFKNKPYQYHNGGRWPMITGFYVISLAKRGKINEAEKYRKGIDQANSLSQNEGEQWGFSEFCHGQTGSPMGIHRQGWSAAATIFSHHAIQDPEKIFL